jgi:hypothetical protein
MRVLLVEGLVSAVYVFDVSAYPFVHVPFILLTLLYLGSMLEILGFVQVARFLRRRFAPRRSEATGRSACLRPATTWALRSVPEAFF